MEAEVVDNTPKPKTPGIVIFAAVLKFFGVALFGFLSLFCVLAMIFGQALGVDQYFRDQLAHMPANQMAYGGLIAVCAVALAVFLAFTLVYLAVALGLIKGKKYAWYMQVTLSTLSLLTLPLAVANPIIPFGAVINLVVLILFFRKPVRGYFKI